MEGIHFNKESLTQEPKLLLVRVENVASETLLPKPAQTDPVTFEPGVVGLQAEVAP